MSKYNIESTAITKFTKQNQSTHGPAPEASAARLIRCLRTAYPDTKTHTAAQGSLIHYLQALSKEEPLILSATDAAATSIAGTLNVIQKIALSELWNQEEKQKIFIQMASIAATCPGINWDEKHMHWSSNAIYNPETKKKELVIASPAETLNLVCKAILDRTHYQPSDSGEDKDEQFRIVALASSLLHLRELEEKGHYEICASGRQHEMLFLLNHSYLETINDQPISLIVDTDTFLLDSLHLYIEETLSSTPDKTQILIDWLLWQQDLSTDKPSPLTQWLTRSQDHWQTQCKDFLEKRCIEFGINPDDCKIDPLISQIDLISVPTSPFIAEILTTKPLAESISATGAAGLDTLHNLALTQMQTSIQKHESLQGIQDFHQAIVAMHILQRYRKIKIFIGEAEGEFLAALEALQQALFHYLADFYPGKPLSKEFTDSYTQFKTQEHAFKDLSQTDFISNYFALHQGHWDEFLERLYILNTTHSLILTDSQLQQWQQDAITPSPEGGVTVDVSPYQINRILLQAFLVPPQHWTPTYRTLLMTLTEWLLTPNQPGDSGLLIAFKEVYPKNILQNLFMATWILQHHELNTPSLKKFILHWDGYHTSSRSLWLDILRSTELDSERQPFLHALQPKLITFIPNFNVLSWLFALEQLSTIQRDQILTAIIPHLTNLITKATHFVDLFELPLDKLNTEQRDQIIAVTTPQLGSFVTRFSTLEFLLSLPSEKLNALQRDQILTAIIPQLASIVIKANQLTQLFSLPIEQLTAAQRAQIWSTITPQLNNLFTNANQLRDLFALPLENLNMTQRAQIWNAVTTQLEALITNAYQLRNLFQLSFDQLMATQRDQIWDAITPKLASLITTIDHLKYLFSLSPEQLSTTQRDQIWDAITPKLASLVTSNIDLETLFSLSPEQLSIERRAQILNAIPHTQLASFITTADQLKNLFSLPLEQLPSERRTQILNAIPSEQLASFITMPDQLKNLFSLSIEQLTVEQRLQFLETIPLVLLEELLGKSHLYHEFRNLLALSLEQLTTAQLTQIQVIPRLGRLITDKSQLIYLFSQLTQLTIEQKIQILETIPPIQLGESTPRHTIKNLFQMSLEQLTATQRSQIQVIPRLGQLITNAHQLTELFSLPLKQLTAAQRAQIWDIITPRLSMLVTKAEHLTDLFALSLKQFTAEQRTQIWSAITQKWAGIITDTDQLKTLFALSKKQLSTEQRAQIWSTITPQLASIKIDIYQLKRLFDLSLKQFSTEQRAQIWSAITPQLASFVANAYQLEALFRLSIKQLTTEQRTQLLKAIPPTQLANLVTREDQLKDLFLLPQEQLNTEQRTLILTAMTPRIREFILNAKNLKSLFSLSIKQLTSEQRTQILKAIPPTQLASFITKAGSLESLFSLSSKQLTSEQLSLILKAVAPEPSSPPVAASRRQLLKNELQEYISSVSLQSKKKYLLFHSSTPPTDVLIAQKLLAALDTPENIEDVFRRICTKIDRNILSTGLGAIIQRVIPETDIIETQLTIKRR